MDAGRWALVAMGTALFAVGTVLWFGELDRHADDSDYLVRPLLPAILAALGTCTVSLGLGPGRYPPMTVAIAGGGLAFLGLAMTILRPVDGWCGGLVCSYVWGAPWAWVLPVAAAMGGQILGAMAYVIERDGPPV